MADTKQATPAPSQIVSAAEARAAGISVPEDAESVALYGFRLDPAKDELSDIAPVGYGRNPDSVYHFDNLDSTGRPFSQAGPDRTTADKTTTSTAEDRNLARSTDESRSEDGVTATQIGTGKPNAAQLVGGGPDRGQQDAPQDALDALESFGRRYPTLLSNVFDRINAIARVAPHGKHGITLRNVLESVAIAGVIVGRAAKAAREGINARFESGGAVDTHADNSGIAEPADRSETIAADVEGCAGSLPDAMKRSPVQFAEYARSMQAELKECGDILPDSLNRPLATRIRGLLERANREADLAVRLSRALDEQAAREDPGAPK